MLDKCWIMLDNAGYLGPKRAEGASSRDQRAASLDAPDVIEGNLIPDCHMYTDSVDMTKCVIARYNPKYT